MLARSIVARLVGWQLSKGVLGKMKEDYRDSFEEGRADVELPLAMWVFVALEHVSSTRAVARTQ